MEGRAVGVAVVVLLAVLGAGLVPEEQARAVAPGCADELLTELRPGRGRDASLLACPERVEALVRRLGGPAGARAAPGAALVVDGAGSPGAAPAGGGVRLLLRRPLDPDSATAADLALLPGIGPGLAARIIEDRARRGSFAAAGGLGRVRGIGRARLAALAGWVRGSPAGEGASEP